MQENPAESNPCLDCEELRQRYQCDACALKGLFCECGKPGTRWVQSGKYAGSMPYCDDDDCLPYTIGPDGQIYWIPRGKTVE